MVDNSTMQQSPMPMDDFVEPKNLPSVSFEQLSAQPSGQANPVKQRKPKVKKVYEPRVQASR